MTYIGILISNGCVVFAKELSGDVAANRDLPDALAKAQDELDAVRQADECWDWSEGDTCQIWADGHPVAYFDGSAHSWETVTYCPERSNLRGHTD